MKWLNVMWNRLSKYLKIHYTVDAENVMVIKAEKLQILHQNNKVILLV